MIVTDGSLALTNNVAWAKSRVYLEVQATSGFSNMDYYYVDVFLREGGQYEISFASFRVTPDSTGNIKIYLHPYLAAWLRSKFWGRRLPDNTANRDDKPDFWVEIIEYNPFNISNEYRQFTALLAGLANDDYASMNAWHDEASPKFLSTAFRPKPTHKLAYEYLYFWGAAASSYYLRVDIVREDGSESTFHPPGIGSPDEGLFRFDSSYAGTGMSNYETDSPILSYKVAIATSASGDDTDLYTDWFEYKLEDYPILSERNFLFQNSFGVYDTLMAYGHRTEGLEVKREVLMRDKGSTVLYDRGEQMTLVSATKRGGQDATLWLPIDYARCLEDFLLSEEFYVRNEDGTKWLPITIRQSKFNHTRTNEDILGLEIEYEYANNPRLYTP